MEAMKDYTFERFYDDLEKGHKILFTYVRNRYVIFQTAENCYTQKLVQQMSRNSVPENAMITYKAIKQMFAYMEDMEYMLEINK